jgi:transcriptional regulator NrdR family protein
MSMDCGKCQVRALCTDTRSYPSYVRRRYKCDKCNDRWTTVEHRVSSVKRGSSVEAAFRYDVKNAAKAEMREEIKAMLGMTGESY